MFCYIYCHCFGINIKCTETVVLGGSHSTLSSSGEGGYLRQSGHYDQHINMLHCCLTMIKILLGQGFDLNPIFLCVCILSDQSLYKSDKWLSLPSSVFWLVKNFIIISRLTVLVKIYNRIKSCFGIWYFYPESLESSNIWKILPVGESSSKHFIV